MSQKQVHYNIDNISKEKANINLIYGEKSNGKSYQVKHKKGILPFLDYVEKIKKENAIKSAMINDERFILMRRWKEDITKLWIEKYFSDVDVAKITDNQYNMVTSYRGELFLSTFDYETNKVTRGLKIGYVMALSTEQHYSGGSFLDVKRIIFEEFMERGGIYIKNEPDRLMYLYSTVDRKRGTTELWLVGNSVSRVCPYIKAWGLDKIFLRLKQGEIATKEIDNDGTIVKIAVEYCRSSGGKNMAIGNASQMINTGAWETQPQPKLPKSRKYYNKLYVIGFQYKGFKFLCEYLKDKETNEVCWFIYPYYKDFGNIFIFSDEIKTSIYWQRDIYNMSIKNEKIKNLLATFKENKIFYSDDLCGTDFKQVIDFTIRR